MVTHFVNGMHIQVKKATQQLMAGDVAWYTASAGECNSGVEWSTRRFTCR